MIYLINHLILFNEKDGTLAWRDRENEAISLGFPVSRLFLLLMENAGVTLSREVLLKEALEKNALSPSINNLNNYLSLLRKALREFELAEAIVTIPKLGVVFNVTSIECYQNEDEIGSKEEAEVTVRRAEKPALSIRYHVVSEPIDKRQYAKFFLVLGGVFILILGLLMNYNPFPYRYLSSVDVQGKCDLFYLYDSVDYPIPTDYESLCADNVLFFLSKNIHISGDLNKKTEIVISCNKDGKGCVTYVNN
ncbi:CadC family transcriptional regulator [Brenneria roseae subsp. roseae]|uniref:winged helix-turn-helix domain-containing protein n=1 Tax=Brenneria roseae TaxID=1509241 RepID=UPI000D61AC1C|nr:winged helix-turn-helix domain-containing protein [Brenneria roseae]PWC20488.1 CadC family transcriptional regulator [Brenneria roseae subsp. roseae]